jgi:hypothetical protein
MKPENEKLEEKYWSRYSVWLPVFVLSLFAVLVLVVLAPDAGAHPAIGSVGKLEQVAESRIETPVLRERVRDVIAAVRKVHPYEEPVIDIYPLLDEEELLG